MHILLPHTFTKEAAKARVESALRDSAPQIAENTKEFESAWENETLNFSAVVQGQKITGSLEIDDHQYVLDAKLPLMWRMFEGQIQKAIERQVAALK